MTFPRVATLFTVLLLGSFRVAAAEPTRPPVVPEPAAAERLAVALPLNGTYTPTATRPALLPALYVTLGAMQILDVYSTQTALRAGAHEANPTMAPVAHSSAAMFGLKAATTASTILLTERMWKKNRVGAVVLMTVINGATAAVAMHNLHNARLAGAR